MPSGIDDGDFSGSGQAGAAEQSGLTGRDMLWLVLAIKATPAGMVWPRIKGNSAMMCFFAIMLVSALPLAAGLRVLGGGASPAPMLSGAALGLAVGSLAATLYAFFCTQDSPLFFLTWYGLAIAVVTLAGAVAGRGMLRW